MLERLKKRRVKSHCQFKLLLTEWYDGQSRYLRSMDTDDSFKNYPTFVYVARTHRRKYGLGKEECIEVGWSRTYKGLTDVHKYGRLGRHIIEPIEDSEREAILRALWRLTEKVYLDARVMGTDKRALWTRVMTGFILGESLPVPDVPATVRDPPSLYFEKPEDV